MDKARIAWVSELEPSSSASKLFVWMLSTTDSATISGGSPSVSTDKIWASLKNVYSGLQTLTRPSLIFLFGNGNH